MMFVSLNSAGSYSAIPSRRPELQLVKQVEEEESSQEGKEREPTLGAKSGGRLVSLDATTSVSPSGEAVATEADTPDWTELVAGVQQGLPGSVEQLYGVFNKGIRYYLAKHLGPEDLEDRVHDTFLIVLQSIKKGEVREPERLMGFVRTITRRTLAAHIDAMVHQRKESAGIDPDALIPDTNANPERDVIRRQKVDVVLKTLEKLSERDRELLHRFYLKEESQETICEAMSLSETQFRLMKSRAKARLGLMGKKEIGRDVLLRKAAR
jgi:RNA polymerase sigma-70 factor, ECF subfamily